MLGNNYELVDVKKFEGTARYSEKYVQMQNELMKKETETLINKKQLERDRDWSELNHQIFGAEVN